MKSHELAKKLLETKNIEVVVPKFHLENTFEPIIGVVEEPFGEGQIFLFGESFNTDILYGTRL